jgi:hypothetical protein
VFTARYALSPYIKQIRFVFLGLNQAAAAVVVVVVVVVVVAAAVVVVVVVVVVADFLPIMPTQREATANSRN